MKGEPTRRRADIIDATQWLRGRVERLIEGQNFAEAVGYLQRISPEELNEGERLQRATYLGYLYLLTGELGASEQWLERAQELAQEDPHLFYALGHVAMGRGEASRAVMHLLEAFVEAEERHDEAEFLRSAALAMMQALGQAAAPAAMLLGALDRDLGNPWILDALAQVYAADERWLESLEALATLADVVRDAANSMVVYRAPTARQLLRNRLMGNAAQPEELQRRVRALNQALRRQFEVVLDARQRRGPTGLAPLRFPPALSRLVQIFEYRDRGVALIELAQSIWARAVHEGFEQSLGPDRLAAATYLLVERLQWRVPTPLEVAAQIFDEPAGAVAASARVIAGRLKLELFDAGALKASLAPQHHERLDELQRALLFGEGLVQARHDVVRLG